MTPVPGALTPDGTSGHGSFIPDAGPPVKPHDKNQSVTLLSGPSLSRRSAKAQSIEPAGTTHSQGCPVRAAIRSKSAS